MVQNESNLVVADNSGARIVRIFRQLGGARMKVSSIGDIVLGAVKDAAPNASSSAPRDRSSAKMAPPSASMIMPWSSSMMIITHSAPVSSDRSPVSFVKRDS